MIGIREAVTVEPNASCGIPRENLPLGWRESMGGCLIQPTGHGGPRPDRTSHLRARERPMPWALGPWRTWGKRAFYPSSGRMACGASSSGRRTTRGECGAAHRFPCMHYTASTLLPSPQNYRPHLSISPIAPELQLATVHVHLHHPAPCANLPELGARRSPRNPAGQLAPAEVPMARSIVLRFDSTCVDCGRSLPAGSTARWFGRGRVSCCGSPSNAPAAPVAVAPAPQPRALPRSAFVPGSIGFAAAQPPAPAPITPAQSAALPPELARALQCGMQSTHVAELARIAPSTRLCVRLDSGARFIVTAEHAAHVLACIVESCRDRIRDVMGAA